MQTITTRHTSNASGRTQVIAKGAGKQRTITFDQAVSSQRNHGTAAGTLAQVLGLNWHDGITHEQSEDGTVHRFKF